MTKPTVAVIGGTGAEGSGLAVRWAAAGHPVVIGSRSTEKAAVVSEELRELLPDGSAPLTGATNAEAATAGDVVVLSVPYSSQEAIIAQIADGCQGKVFVTVGVPLKPPTVSTVWRPPGGSAAAEAQAQLGPGVCVVAAYQNIAAGHLKDLTWQADSDVLIAGDSADAKRIVTELVRDSGFYAIDAGPLANAPVLEGLTAVLIGINIRYKARGTGIRVTGLPRE
jgi:8-hydroxy-5-deazaflavin:NADPH oxidoreductase